MTRLVPLALVLASALACSSTNPRPEEPHLAAGAPEWVYDPNFDWDEDDEPDVIYARGQAEILRNRNLAEQKAQADAMADIRAFIEASIERLTEAWINESGDNMQDGSRASIVNDEMITRQVIEGTLGGARQIGMWWDDQYYYVWMKYDAASAFSAYQSSVEAQLREANRQLTKEEREAMRAEMERVLAERRARR